VGNGSAYTVGKGPAPVGTQVADIQQLGQMGQSFS
jgi:hypothetical protein